MKLLKKQKGPFLSKSKGFTLIELLVVVAIIALIGGLLIVSVGSSRAKSRDSKRIADLGSIQLALETFRDSTANYPTTQLVTQPGSLRCWVYSSDNTLHINPSGSTCDGVVDTWDGTNGLDDQINKYIQVLPKDPINNTTGLFYRYMGHERDYKLMARLEDDEDAMTNDGGSKTDEYEIFTSGAQAW